MTSITDNFMQAELALAGYGDFAGNRPTIAELTKDSVGMSPTQAAAFAERWRVVEQYNGEPYEVTDEFGITKELKKN